VTPTLQTDAELVDAESLTPQEEKIIEYKHAEAVSSSQRADVIFRRFSRTLEDLALSQRRTLNNLERVDKEEERVERRERLYRDAAPVKRDTPTSKSAMMTMATSLATIIAAGVGLAAFPSQAQAPVAITAEKLKTSPVFVDTKKFFADGLSIEFAAEANIAFDVSDSRGTIRFAADQIIFNRDEPRTPTPGELANEEDDEIRAEGGEPPERREVPGTWIGAPLGGPKDSDASPQQPETQSDNATPETGLPQSSERVASAPLTGNQQSPIPGRNVAASKAYTPIPRSGKGPSNQTPWTKEKTEATQGVAESQSTSREKNETSEPQARNVVKRENKLPPQNAQVSRPIEAVTPQSTTGNIESESSVRPKSVFQRRPVNASPIRWPDQLPDAARSASRIKELPNEPIEAESPKIPVNPQRLDAAPSRAPESQEQSYEQHKEKSRYTPGIVGNPDEWLYMSDADASIVGSGVSRLNKTPAILK
jgi:hypothetical protein